MVDLSKIALSLNKTFARKNRYNGLLFLKCRAGELITDPDTGNVGLGEVETKKAYVLVKPAEATVVAPNIGVDQTYIYLRGRFVAPKAINLTQYVLEGIVLEVAGVVGVFYGYPTVQNVNGAEFGIQKYLGAAFEGYWMLNQGEVPDDIDFEGNLVTLTQDWDYLNQLTLFSNKLPLNPSTKSRSMPRVVENTLFTVSVSAFFIFPLSINLIQETIVTSQFSDFRIAAPVTLSEFPLVETLFIGEKTNVISNAILTSAIAVDTKSTTANIVLEVPENATLVVTDTDQPIVTNIPVKITYCQTNISPMLVAQPDPTSNVQVGFVNTSNSFISPATNLIESSAISVLNTPTSIEIVQGLDVPTTQVISILDNPKLSSIPFKPNTTIMFTSFITSLINTQFLEVIEIETAVAPNTNQELLEAGSFEFFSSYDYILYEGVDMSTLEVGEIISF